MPYLFDSLKQAWINSSHINQDIDKFEQIIVAILNEIILKIKKFVDFRTIFTKEHLDYAISIILTSRTALKSWFIELNRTRTAIENENTPRWDFANTELIFEMSQHMRVVLKELKLVWVKAAMSWQGKEYIKKCHDIDIEDEHEELLYLIGVEVAN